MRAGLLPGVVFLCTDAYNCATTPPTASFVGCKPPKGGFAFSEDRLRTIVYIDGFNLYYGGLKRSPYKWLDLCGLFTNILPAGHQLQKVKYFTARVTPLPGDKDAPIRQDIYLRALRAHCGNRLEIIEGHFLTKPFRAPLTAQPTKIVEVLRSEEKGSDVNLAVQLVHDAWQGIFDCAAVVSNDGDLERALKIVKQELRRKVLLYTPGAPIRKPVMILRRWSHKQLDILAADLARSQLPAQIPGTNIVKPAKW